MKKLGGAHVWNLDVFILLNQFVFWHFAISLVAITVELYYFYFHFWNVSRSTV